MIWTNKERVLAVVKNNGWKLEFASKELKNDKEVVLAAIAQYGWVLKYTSSNELKNYKGILCILNKFDEQIELYKIRPGLFYSGRSNQKMKETYHYSETYHMRPNKITFRKYDYPKFIIHNNL